MGKESFTLTEKEEREIKELLKLADRSLLTSSVILTPKSSNAELVGSVIGGSEGEKILSQGVEIKDIDIEAKGAIPSTVGKSLLGGLGAAAIFEGVGTGAGAAFVTGAGVTLGTVALPIGVIVFLAGLAFGAIFGSSSEKKKYEEKKKMANYCKELSETINKVVEQCNRDIEKFEAMHAKDQETIRKQQEKINEYKLIIAALMSKYGPIADIFE